MRCLKLRATNRERQTRSALEKNLRISVHCLALQLSAAAWREIRQRATTHKKHLLWNRATKLAGIFSIAL